MNTNPKTKNRKALLLLLTGQLLSTSFLWAPHLGVKSTSDFLQGFGVGLSLMLMIGAVILMARNKRQCVSKG